MLSHVVVLRLEVASASNWNLSLRLLSHGWQRTHWLALLWIHRVSVGYSTKAIQGRNVHLRSAIVAWYIHGSSAWVRGHGSGWLNAFSIWHWTAILSWILLLVVVEHVRENVLGILQSLGHLCIVAVQCLIKWHCRSLTLLVDVGHISVFRVQKDFSVILKVNLHDFIAQTEHNSMLGPHPLLDIHRTWGILLLVSNVLFISLNKLLLFNWVIVLLEIGFEVLQESHLFLELFGEVSKVVLRHHILLFICSDGLSFVVVELVACRLSHYFGGVIEEDTSTQVWKKVSESVLGGVVNPLGDPNLCRLVDRSWKGIGLCLSWSLRSLLHVMTTFDWLSCNLSCWCSFTAHANIFAWSWSYWNRRNILWLFLSLILNCWHLNLLYLTLLLSSSLAIISVSCSVSKHLWRCLSWSSGSLTTIQSDITWSQRFRLL